MRNYAVFVDTFMEERAWEVLREERFITLKIVEKEE